MLVDLGMSSNIAAMISERSFKTRSENLIVFHNANDNHSYLKHVK